MSGLVLLNDSGKPDAELEAILQFVLDRPQVALSRRLAVRVVADSRRSCSDGFGGCAYYPGGVPAWARRNRCHFAMTLSLASDVYPYGRPEVCTHSVEWSHLHGQLGSAAAWERLAVAAANGKPPRLQRWPIYQLDSWQEGFVHLAAHEARHLVQFDRQRRPHSEVDCEEWAVKLLNEYRQKGGEVTC